MRHRSNRIRNRTDFTTKNIARPLPATKTGRTTTEGRNYGTCERRENGNQDRVQRGVTEGKEDRRFMPLNPALSPPLGPPRRVEWMDDLWCVRQAGWSAWRGGLGDAQHLWTAQVRNCALSSAGSRCRMDCTQTRRSRPDGTKPKNLYGPTGIFSTADEHSAANGRVPV